MRSIAFINNHFPALSATFIYKEVIGLRNRGLPIRTFSIRRPDMCALSEDSLELTHTTTYLLPVNVSKFIKSHFYYIFKKPLSYFGTFFFLITRKFDNLFKDRIRTILHFCEGVYFARIIHDDGRILHIHSHYASHPCTLAFVASRLTRIPFSFTAHAHDIWEDRLFLRDKINASKFLITCTYYGRQELLKIEGIKNKEKIQTIYHGVDTDKFRPKNDRVNRETFTILNIGRLVKDKAQKNLIEACKLLKEEGYIFECLIVGDGPLMKELKGYINENQLDKEIKLIGKVFQEQICEIYGMADIFVLTSVRENLPNVLLESLAMGIPVIATNIAGIPELIKDKVTGILIELNDPHQLAEKIKLLIKDKRLAKELSENGRKSVCMNFDTNDMINKLEKIYLQLL
jgi:colanic acid/amylovoran biosynthesis glycosyltransferase